MDRLDELLARLSELAAREPHRVVFGPPATEQEIAAAEAEMGVPLPPSYRRFLQRFNGGFISLVGDITQHPHDEASAAWNSNTLFRVSRLVTEYKEQKSFEESVSERRRRWPYVPFCQTDMQEKLVFGRMKSPDAEPRVLDAFHESPPREWSVVYKGFIPLLEDYLAREGRIKQIGGLDE